MAFPDGWLLEARPTSHSVGLASLLDPEPRDVLVPVAAAVAGHRHDHCVVVDFAPLVQARSDWSTLDDVVVGFFDGGLAPFFNNWPVIQAMAQDSVPDRVSNFARRNGCEAAPTIAAGEDGTEHRDWTCPPGAEVRLVIHDGGHDWPAQATDIIWEFFGQHSLSE